MLTQVSCVSVKLDICQILIVIVKLLVKWTTSPLHNWLESNYHEVWYKQLQIIFMVSYVMSDIFIQNHDCLLISASTAYMHQWIGSDNGLLPIWCQAII